VNKLTLQNQLDIHRSLLSSAFFTGTVAGNNPALGSTASLAKSLYSVPQPRPKSSNKSITLSARFGGFWGHALRHPQALARAAPKQKGELRQARLFGASCDTQLLAPL
jgi:hypothetical protein